MTGYVGRQRGSQVVAGMKQALNAMFFWNAADNLVAFAGGGQASATKIVQSMSRFITVATGADSSQLPKSVSGMSLTVTNAGAASMNVFPVNGGTDAINALGANTAFAVAAGKSCEFVCYTAGQWHTLLSA